MHRIKQVSLFFRIFFQILFITTPLLLVIGWVYAPESFKILGGLIDISAIPHTYSSNAQVVGLQNAKGILHTLTITEKCFGFLLSTIPMFVELFILYALIKLFKLYEQGEIFSVSNVRYLRQIGYALFISQMIDPIYQFLMGIVLTMGNPPGHRYAAITLDQTNISILLIALLMILISWIMIEGCKLREEQQLTI